MIDPSFDTVVTPYPPTMQELEERLNNLQIIHDKNLESLEFTRERIQKFSAQINSFEEALKHNEWDFDAATLNDLASYFDITLEREFDVTITVTFSGTVTAPMDYDMDDLENDLQATIDTHHYGNSDVVVDLSEDSMEIDYREY